MTCYAIFRRTAARSSARAATTPFGIIRIPVRARRCRGTRRLAPGCRARFAGVYQCRCHDTQLPNKALQRTEAGGRLFSVYYVLFRQPLSLSLGGVRPKQLSRSGALMVSGFPFLLPVARRLCSPIASTRPFPHGPFHWHVHPSGASSAPLVPPRRQHPSFPRRDHRPPFRRSRGRSVGAGLTTRSSEQRLAVAFFLEFHLLRRQPLSLSLSPLGDFALSPP